MQKWRVSWQRPLYWRCDLVVEGLTVKSWLFDEVRLEDVEVWTETRRVEPSAAWICASGILTVSGEQHADEHIAAEVGGVALIAAGRPVRIGENGPMVRIQGGLTK